VTSLTKVVKFWITACMPEHMSWWLHAMAARDADLTAWSEGAWDVDIV